jgi:hypothetical protein
MDDYCDAAALCYSDRVDCNESSLLPGRGAARVIAPVTSAERAHTRVHVLVRAKASMIQRIR